MKNILMPIVLTFLVIVAILSYDNARNHKNIPMQANLIAGMEVTVSGQVVENVDRRPVDGNAHLIIRSDEGIEYFVTYGYGDSPEPCKKSYGEEISQLRNGTKVTIFAVAENSNSLDICPSDNYFISLR